MCCFCQEGGLSARELLLIIQSLQSNSSTCEDLGFADKATDTFFFLSHEGLVSGVTENVFFNLNFVKYN